jgi:hypothetical protein
MATDPIFDNHLDSKPVQDSDNDGRAHLAGTVRPWLRGNLRVTYACLGCSIGLLLKDIVVGRFDPVMFVLVGVQVVLTVMAERVQARNG